MYNTGKLVIIRHKIIEMKRFILTLLSILLCLLVVHAELLYKVEKPGQATSYIMGTHHVAPASLLDSVPGFAEALSQAATVCGEVEMSSLMMPAGQQELLAAGMAPADSTLSRALSPAQLDSLGAFLGKYLGPQFSVANLEPLKPAMVSSTVALLINSEVFPGFDPSAQLDGLIQRRGTEAGKQVRGLETVADQARVLFGAPIARQAEELMETVRHKDKAADLARKLAALYMAGDLDGLLALMESAEGNMSAADKKALITDRNVRWIPAMEEIMKGGAALFAVGAGHLPGPDGVLELLRAQGYTVSPFTGSDK